MKKLQLLAILFIGLSITSCSSDDDGNSTENQMTFGSSQYVLKAGFFQYYGENPTGVHNYDITLLSSEVNVVDGDYSLEDDIVSGVYFELFTENPTGPAVGIYESANTSAAGTFDSAHAIVETTVQQQNFHSITEGSFEVLQGGPNYEFVFDAVTINGTQISGHYTGTLHNGDNVGRHTANEQPNKLILTKKK